MEAQNENLARRGERVLAFAFLELPADKFHDKYDFDVDKKNFPTSNLTFSGFISLIDPPRPAVAGAINSCYKAGI